MKNNHIPPNLTQVWKSHLL